MSTRTRSTLGLFALAFLAMPGTVGCQTDLTELLAALQDFEININTNVNQVQSRDPRDPGVMLPGGKNLMITEGVDFITDPGDQIDPNSFDDSLLLGVENTSADDMYVEFLVDDEFQSIYVFTGETVLLEYPCATTIEITLEEDYSPGDFTLVNTLDWTGTTFTNPEDFDCGSALIISMDGVSVNAEPEVIDLNTGFGPGMGPGMGPDDGMDPMDPGDPFFPA